MITTETVTDEQLRALHDSTADRSIRRDCIDGMRASTANAEVKRYARFRCVEFLNARNGGRS